MPSEIEKYYCIAEGCSKEIEPPKRCCNGFDCGCQGKPITPEVCSEACFYKAYPHMILNDPAGRL